MTSRFMTGLEGGVALAGVAPSLWQEITNGPVGPQPQAGARRRRKPAVAGSPETDTLSIVEQRSCCLLVSFADRHLTSDQGEEESNPSITLTWPSQNQTQKLVRFETMRSAP